MRHVNRRESPRVEIKLRCYVTSPGVWFRDAMYVENISRTSLLLAWRSDTGAVLPPVEGQNITVDVELPANHNFGVKCIHCQGVVTSISFEDLDCPRVAVNLSLMDFRPLTDVSGVGAQSDLEPVFGRYE